LRWCRLGDRRPCGIDQDGGHDDQRRRNEGRRSSLEPAPAAELATMDDVSCAAERLAQLVRDRVFEFLGECFVARTLRVPSGQHCLGTLSKAEIADGQLEDVSDLGTGQPGVAVQDNGRALVVAERSEVSDDWLGSGHWRRAIDQLDALPIFPRQIDRCARGSDHRSNRFQLRMRLSRPAPVQLGNDQLDDPRGLYWITREEVCRRLHERTLTLDHSRVLLIADRRHAPPLS